MIGIYAIRNTLNNKMYIGESINIEARWEQHYKELSDNNHHSFKLQEDWNATSRSQFRLIILEDFVFPLRKEIDVTKLQLILYCRERYYMKKYTSISNGYNIENTLKEIMTGSEKYPKFNKQEYKDFIRENKDILLSDKFNLDILNSLCEYSEDNKFGNKLYINAESSPQPVNPIYTTYYDKKRIAKQKVKSETDKELKKSKQPKQYTSQNVPQVPCASEDLVPRSTYFRNFSDEFRNKYSPSVIYYKEVKDGLLTYTQYKNNKRRYILTEKGLNSGYFVVGNKSLNGYKTGQILLTQSGKEYYDEISSNILNYVPIEKIFINDYGRYSIAID